MSAKQEVLLVLLVAGFAVGTVSADIGHLDGAAILSWGRDNYGQVSDTPVETGFTAAAVSSYHGIAVKTDGSLAAWGHDGYDQVSDMPTGTDFAAVAASGQHSLVLKTDGSLVSWGRDTAGVVSNTPTGTDFAAVTTGGEFSLALRTNGSLVAWGWNDHGQVSGTPAGTGFAAVAAGDIAGVAVKTDGSLVAWGADHHGLVSDTPAGTDFATVAAGQYHGVALKTDGSLLSWGSNFYGQVSHTPAGTDFVAVAAANDYSVALKTDGSLVAWGQDEYGQVNSAPVGIGFTAVGAGSYTGLAVGLARSYDDLLVTGTGPTALLNRNVTVSGNVTVETTMVTENAPTMNVEGVTTFASGGSVLLGEGETLNTAGLRIEDGGLVEVNGGTLDFEEALVQTGGRLQVHGDLHSLVPLFLEGGTVEAPTFRLWPESTVSGHGMIDADFWCSDVAPTLTADGGTLTVGKADSYSGFAMPRGEIIVNPGATLELLAKGFVSLPARFTLDSGTLAAPNGVLVPAGHNLPGSGAVTGRVSAAFGSTIDATGDIVLGDTNAYDGFFSDGSLMTGANTVTINDRNEAVLGSLTQLGDGVDGGTLTAGNAAPADTYAHFLLEQGKNMVGRGSVNGNYKNHGHVIGDGIAPPQRIVFESGWTVTGKGTFEYVGFKGTFAPGDSPTITSTTHAWYADATVQVELGGTTPGSGDSNHDQINDTATVWLDHAEPPTLEILPWNNFVPEIGDEFVILTWQTSLDGAFGDVIVDPWFTDHGLDFDLHYNNVGGAGNLTIEATPEPATLTLLTLGGLALVRRRKHR